MKILFLFLCSFFYICNCNAYEQCDHKFHGGIPAKYKVTGKAPDGTNLVDIFIVDSLGNLANGYICQYKGTNLILREYIINGKINGVAQSFYENGNLRWESEYRNGINNGFSKYYFDNGKLDKIFNYRDGMAISAKCANGYKWTDQEVYKWNQGGDMRNSVRNICKNK